MISLDVFIGQRVRALRQAIGMDAGDVAAFLSVRLQSYMEMERGARRIKPSQLTALGKLFEVAVIKFFEELEAPLAPHPPKKVPKTRKAKSRPKKAKG